MNLAGKLRTASVLAVLAAPAAAQNVFFLENFNSGLPASWTQFQLGDPFDRWTWVASQPGNGTGGMYHEWFCHNGFAFRDNILLSPPIDLRGLTNATFRCDQYQQFPTSRLFNAVRVTRNNGASYTTIYQETGTWTGAGTIAASMNAFAGQQNVRLAFHYQGVIANNWWIDNVEVTTTNPIHTIASLVANATATFEVRGVAPGNPVMISASLTGPGPIPTLWGNVNLSDPVIALTFVPADAAGRASLSVAIPPGTQGMMVYSHAAEFRPNGTVNLSSSVARAVQ
jgi:hypothetical protein